MRAAGRPFLLERLGDGFRMSAIIGKIIDNFS
jgi:hypothetical protein